MSDSTDWPRIERAHPVARDRPATALAMALVAGAFAIVLAGMPSELFDLERHAAPKELALHATALVCVPLLLRGWRRVRLGVVDAALAAFVIWSGVSALFAANRWLSLRAFGVTFSGYIVYRAARRIAWGADDERGALVGVDAMDPGRVNQAGAGQAVWRVGRASAVLAGLAAAAITGASIGIAQAYGFDAEWLAARRAPGGTFGNRNFLAHVLAIAAPGMLLLAMLPLRGRARVLRWLAFAGLAAAAAAIVLTRSRAAWLGLAAGAGAMLLLGAIGRGALVGRLRAGAAGAAAVTVIIAVAAAVLLPNRLEWRSDSPYAETLVRIGDFREGSGRGRLIQYGNSLELIAYRPVLGLGPGNWFVHYPRVTEPGDPSFAGADPIPTNPWPSSDWVAFATERGPIGALLLLGAGVLAIVIVLRRLRQPAPAGTEAAPAGVALAGTLAAALVTGAFDAVLLLAAPSFYVFTTLGLLLPPTRPVVDRATGRRLGLGLRAGAVAIAVALVLSSVGQVVAIRIAGTGSDRAALERAAHFDPGSHRLRLGLARRGGCSRRIPHARAAAALMPHHAAPRRALAACGERPE